MYVSQWLTDSADRDFTDVTLVSDDTNYFTWVCDLDDPEDPDDHNNHDDHDDHDAHDAHDAHVDHDDHDKKWK